MERTATPDLWPAAPALGATSGAVQLGTYLTLILFGAFALQVHRYVRLYHMDCTLIRSFVRRVAAMMSITFMSSDSVQPDADILGHWSSSTSFSACMSGLQLLSYFYLVSNFGHQDRLPRCVWSINLLPLNTGLAIFVFQAFFAHRVYLTATVEAFIHQTFDEVWKDTWTVSVALGASVTCDVLLTGVLVYVLQHSRTAFGRTDSIVDGLIAYAMNTGLLIGVFNVAALVFALVLPDNLVYAAAMTVATSLYANSLMAVYVSQLDGDHEAILVGKIMVTTVPDSLIRFASSLGPRFACDAFHPPTGLPQSCKGNR
ncbi:hypothetical protein C8Q73DRAFT_2034 [Cubamyces lactineus]|nr:hypothetical protein C8Q73DRAFT_2034 [Cubamyces lactineus]